MGRSEPGEAYAASAAEHSPNAQSRQARGSRRRQIVRETEGRELWAHIAVADALAAWSDMDTGLASLLAALTESLDCEAAVLWVPSGDRLRPRTFWQPVAGDLGAFKVMTLTSRLSPGRELPGQAWERALPVSRGASDGDGPPRWRAAVAAGLRGAIAFPAIWAEEVIAVIELVSREEPELTDQLDRTLAAIGSVLGHFLARRRGSLDGRLVTERQLEILTLAAAGLSGREIAERLVVSPSTVKTHLEHSYTRLGVSNRAAAVAEAMRLGLVE